LRWGFSISLVLDRQVEDFVKIEEEKRTLGMAIFSILLDSLRIDGERWVVELDSDHDIGCFPGVLLAFCHKLCKIYIGRGLVIVAWYCERTFDLTFNLRI